MDGSRVFSSDFPVFSRVCLRFFRLFPVWMVLSLLPQWFTDFFVVDFPTLNGLKSTCLNPFLSLL